MFIYCSHKTYWWPIVNYAFCDKRNNLCMILSHPVYLLLCQFSIKILNYRPLVLIRLVMYTQSNNIRSATVTQPLKYIEEYKHFVWYSYINHCISLVSISVLVCISFSSIVLSVPLCFSIHLVLYVVRVCNITFTVCLDV